MDTLKTYCNEKGQPLLIELPYKEYFALRLQAESASELQKSIDAGFVVLNNDLTADPSKFSLTQGVATAAPLEVMGLADTMNTSPAKDAPKTVEAPEPREMVFESVIKPRAQVIKQPEPIKEAAPAEQPMAHVPAAVDVSMVAAETSVAAAVAVQEMVAVAETAPAVAVPKMIVDYLTSQDPDGGLMEVFRHYYQALGTNCGGSLSATFQEGHICLWNYDEWNMFAFVDVNKGQLRLSVNESLAPAGRKVEFWVPPKWMGGKKLVRISLDAFSGDTLNLLVDAFRSV